MLEKKKESGQQANKAAESSKAFNRTTKVGLALYLLVIALILTINFTEKTDDINEITNLIFVLSPLLFTKFLKERYEYLHTKEFYNISRNDKEIEYENKALTFLLSAMATFPIIMYLVTMALRSVNYTLIALFLFFTILLVLVAVFLYYFFTAFKFPKDNDKNEFNKDSKEKNYIPPSS